jgi:hypothetical protein
MRKIQGARARVLHNRQQDADAAAEELIDDFEPPVNDEGLRLDGPTIEEYVAANYAPANYPPEGYAALDSPGWTLEQERRRLANRSGPGFVDQKGEPAADNGRDH